MKWADIACPNCILPHIPTCRGPRNPMVNNSDIYIYVCIHLYIWKCREAKWVWKTITQSQRTNQGLCTCSSLYLYSSYHSPSFSPPVSLCLANSYWSLGLSFNITLSRKPSMITQTSYAQLVCIPRAPCPSPRCSAPLQWLISLLSFC